MSFFVYLQSMERSWWWGERSWPAARCSVRFSHGAQPRTHRQNLQQKNNDPRVKCVWVCSLMFIIKVFKLNVALLLWIDLWLTKASLRWLWCDVILTGVTLSHSLLFLVKCTFHIPPPYKDQMFFTVNMNFTIVKLKKHFSIYNCSLFLRLNSFNISPISYAHFLRIRHQLKCFNC